MRYFIPVVRLGAELALQGGVEDKLGGLPWGLAASRWPKCSACGGSQSLLAQLRHHAGRLDLGREGRVLHVFQCSHNPGLCEEWDGKAGGNACFVVEPEEVLNMPTTLPADRPEIGLEVRITSWQEQDDGIPASEASAFFDDDKRSKLGDEVLSKVPTGTRLAGVPYWVQSANEAPRGDWRFVGQIDSVYDFPTDANSQEALPPGSGPNFGDAGIGYVFVRHKDGVVPEGYFFWQCA